MSVHVATYKYTVHVFEKLKTEEVDYKLRLVVNGWHHGLYFVKPQYIKNRCNHLDVKKCVCEKSTT